MRAHSITDHIKPNALRFERRNIGAIVITFDGSIIHEIQLDVANSPAFHYVLIPLPEIGLRYLIMVNRARFIVLSTRIADRPKISLLYPFGTDWNVRFSERSLDPSKRWRAV